MADDVAKLGIAVDSAGLKSGTQDLKDFQKEANKTADAADNLNKKWNQGGAKKFADDAKNIKAAVNEQTGAFDAAAAAVQGLASRQIGLVALGGAVVGVTASIGAGAAIMAYQWSTAQASINQSLIGIGRQTGQTVQDINKFSFANASATGLSVGQARDAAVEFNKLGQVSVSQLKGLGDAVYGFSVLTGQDAAKASKELAGILSGDLTKGAQQLNSVYGTLDGKTIELVSTLDSQGKKTEAVQVILDKLASQNKGAKDSVDILTKSWSGLGNALSYVKNAIPNALSSSSLEDQIAGKQSVLASLPDTSNFSRVKDKLKSEIADLQRSLDSINAKAAETNLAQLSVAADSVVKSVFPQIDAIKRLKSELDTLGRAKGSPQGLSQYDNDAATAISNQIAALEDAQGQAGRYNQRVAEISKSWGDVGQSTALSLQAAQNQQPVLEAVGGAAKMAAQYAADYANNIDRGKTSTEAAALAASHMAASQAQVNSAAKANLASLRDQYAVASASSVQDRILAQGRATYNELVRQGVSDQLAGSVANAQADVAEETATQQIANARAQVYEQMQKAVKASQDQLDLARAAGTDQEASVKSAIAYSNAMDAGATSAQAAAISTNVLYSETLRAAQAANQLADAEEAAQRSARSAQYSDSGGEFPGLGQFSPKDGITGANALTPLGESWLWSKTMNDNQAGLLANGGQLLLNNSLAGGGINSAISTLKGLNTTPSNGLPFNTNGVNLIPPNADFSQVFQNIDALYQLKNAQTNDNSVKKANLQEELAWLQSQPETLARDQAIVQLYNSIKDLTNATDANTAATLNPLYSQGHGALAIGYYHAATGLDVVAQGNGGTDSIPFHAMVSPNERIRIGSPANNNDSAGMSLTQIINVSGDDTPQRRRNAIQRAQGFVAAAR